MVERKPESLDIGKEDATQAARPEGTPPSTFPGGQDATIPGGHTASVSPVVGTGAWDSADSLRDTPAVGAWKAGEAPIASADAASAATLPPTAPAPSPLSQALPTDVTVAAAALRTQDVQRAVLEASPKTQKAGTSFGDYELLSPIAKGGMGIVYKARQRKLNRIVAIKMILAGQFADQSDIDRFYVEAEAAAALSHPNIVAIHEVGEINGQHFFSMEYVDGQSLAALVAENPLPPRRAAEFLKTIAETMQFAHDSGIVHRDLKPSNILLDKKKRPLVTDFGLAKHVSNQSQLTMAGSIVGTPSYMPPEQAAGNLDEIGPWSDLYSLGAILYELLTGRPPFRAASPFETVRQVLDTEPLSPRALNPQVPKDVETICLKCLQKQRANRYASAQELADELDRYLKGEPIQARPISRAARLWRLCKRYPVTASSIAGAVAALVVATVVSTSFYLETAAALAKESIAKAKEEESRRDAMKVVDSFLTRFSEDALFNLPGMQKVRQDLLELALANYQKFLKDRGDDLSVQNELAAAYYRVGQITEALQSPDDALPSYDTARKMQVELLARQPNNAARLEALGNTLNAMGTVWIKKQDYDAAEHDYDQAAQIRTRLVEVDQANREYKRALANTHMNRGVADHRAALVTEDDNLFVKRMDNGRKQLEKAQSIRQEALVGAESELKLRRDLGKGYFNLGCLDRDASQRDQAIQHFRAAVQVFEQLTAADASDLDNQKLAAMCYRYLGDVLYDEQADERRRLYQAALDRLQPLAQQNPDVVDYQTERAGLLMNLFDVETQAGKPAAALAALSQAKDIYADVATRFPTVPQYQLDLAIALRELAVAQGAAGSSAEAAKNLQEAIRILTAIVEQDPQAQEFVAALKSTKAVKLPSANEYK